MVRKPMQARQNARNRRRPSASRSPTAAAAASVYCKASKGTRSSRAAYGKYSDCNQLQTDVRARMLGTVLRACVHDHWDTPGAAYCSANTELVIVSAAGTIHHRLK